MRKNSPFQRIFSVCLKIVISLILVCAGIALVIFLRSYLFRLPRFSSSEHFQIAAILSANNKNSFVVIFPETGEVRQTKTANQAIQHEYVRFLQPCNLGPSVVCILGYSRRCDDLDGQYIFQWQFETDVTARIAMIKDARNQKRAVIGVTDQGVYFWGGQNYERIYQTTFDGEEKQIAEIDSDLRCNDAISPDGQFIAFSCTSRQAWDNDDLQIQRDGTRILLLNLQDNLLRQITEPGYFHKELPFRNLMDPSAINRKMAWSVDSTQIAFVKADTVVITHKYYPQKGKGGEKRKTGS